MHFDIHHLVEYPLFTEESSHLLTDWPASMLETLLYQPGHLIRRAHQLAWAAFMDETKGQDITPVQYAALVAIAENPGIDATRLSQLIAFDRATIGNVLDRLEKKSFLKRVTSPGDRRAKQTFLTAEGKRAIKTISQSVEKIAERIWGDLSARERRMLTVLLSKLVNIEQVGLFVRAGALNQSADRKLPRRKSHHSRSNIR